MLNKKGVLMTHQQAMQSTKELEQFGSRRKFPLLSVYLGADNPGDLTPKALTAQFHSLVHSSLTAEQKDHFRPDITYIEQYLSTYHPDAEAARSVALFSAGGGRQLWKEFHLQHSFEPLMQVSHKPYVTPIVRMYEADPCYVVLLVNQKRARLLSIQMGQVAEDLQITNPELIPDVRVNKDEGKLGGQDKAFRHSQKYLNQYLKKVASAAQKFARKTGARYVILGGHREMISKMKGLLPTKLKELVRGELIALPEMPTAEVLFKSRQLAHAFARPALPYQDKRRAM